MKIVADIFIYLFFFLLLFFRENKTWHFMWSPQQHSFVVIDHEIFSTVILSLLLIQEGQLSVSGERMCTILVNRLED